MKEIVISGWYGNRNLGDEAILSAIISDLYKEIPDLHITVVSDDVDHTRKLHKVDAINSPIYTIRPHKIDLKKIDQFNRLVHNADLFILGGGGLIHPGSVHHLLKILNAKMLGAKTMLYSVGVESPLFSYKEKLLIRFILNHFTDVITVRNEMSKVILTELGVKHKIHVTADPAINLQRTNSQRVDEILQRENVSTGKTLVGLCLRDWNVFTLKKSFQKKSTYYKSKIKFDKLLSYGINYITNELDRNVLMIPFQVSKDHNDREEMENLIKNSNLNKDHIYILKEEYTPQEIKGVLSKTEFIVGMRLHSLIFGAANYTPLIGLSYFPKVSEFMRQMELSSYCMSINEKLSWKVLKSMIDSIIINRENISAGIKHKITTIQEKARISAKIAAKLVMG